jgi:nickel/cobalt exporter
VRPVARRGAPGRRGSTSARWPRRIAVLAALVATLLAAGAAPAAAHPLGNFTTNSSGGLRVGPDRLVVDYVLDLAEIPAFQARRAIDNDRDGRVGTAEAAAWHDRECPRLAAGLRAEVDGQPLTLRVTGAGLAFPKGVGGLETLRLECALAAPLPPGGGTRTLTYTDGNHPDRVGWREITAVGDHATLESTDVPARSPSAHLTAYPSDQLGSPLHQRTATLRFRPGAQQPGGACPAAHVRWPRRPGGACSVVDPVAGGTGRGGVDRATAAFMALVGERWLEAGFAVVALLVAVVLGAAHALAPGHGKTVMAAYLVGLRGSLRQAAAIGATVTITHTAGVLLLGLVLTTSRAVAPERLYPWLGLASGLLLAAVGVALLARALAGNSHPTRTTTPMPTPTATPTPMTTAPTAGTLPSSPGRSGGGGWWPWGWPGGWSRARRRWWCCWAGSPSASPGSGWPWCWPTGSAWPPPSPGSACSWPTSAPGWTAASTSPPDRRWPASAGSSRPAPPR